MIDWMTDALGPLATGVLLLGVAPAVVMVGAMIGITRLVDWWGSRGPVLAEERKPELEAPSR